MKHLVLGLFSLSFALGSALFAQADGIKTKTTYAKAYGETKNAVTVDAAKDLPRYPAVEPKDAISTWQVKKGFKLQLAAHEPQVRDPIAICFDEHGRMFVCEMHDYSEMREVTPHMGRISMLQDKDGDGYYETSQIFADDMPWPTGLVWANGGLYVGATPDIWRFEDKDGDGKAEKREKVFTGFGTGLKMLNVQGLMNSFMWGQDNRIHILAGGGNRGVITCLKRPDLKGIELGGKDFWFNPLTHEFGLEGGGAQYGMSFDNYGRKFGCSNSDHLQYWVYDDQYANRNPYYQMPRAKESIAVDGGAAEVFRISPDEPWRIIRTRWRIAGVVKGAVEGGGRVSGYFTGATGTTIYRGDAYGPEFVNNSFSGDAGGQLVHRKIIKPSADGISLIGERPADEHGFEFAASKDTWVRVVNFANAPDGCLHICDMYREVIEHPWSIPDEIKKHIDLNNGNDRGRIYRIVPEGWQRAKGEERRGNIAKASTEELVKLLSHPNGWHRDTAQRLLFERQDKAAVPMLEKVVAGDNALAKLHAMGTLDGLSALKPEVVITAAKDQDAQVRERAIHHIAKLANGEASPEWVAALGILIGDSSARVRFQSAMAASTLKTDSNDAWMAKLASAGSGDKWISAAVLSNANASVFNLLSSDLGKLDAGFVESLILIVAGSEKNPQVHTALIHAVAGDHPKANWVQALGTGLRRAGTTIEKADTEGRLAAILAKASETTADAKAKESARLEAIELLGLSSSKEATDALTQCLVKGQPETVQAAAVKILAQKASAEVTTAIITSWAGFDAKAKESALTALVGRDDRTVALLEAVQSGAIAAADLSASQVQSLVKHKDTKIATLAKAALKAVIPPSREEVTAKFKPTIAAKGDAQKGQVQYMTRCVACHKAGTLGLAVGPDLITVKTKGREALLTAILEPHKEVASQFIAYTVNTKDGQTLAGIITNDTASSMTLKMMGGIEKTLQRAEIKGSTSIGQSLMPEGLETGMNVEDMADLISYIESL
ncbi:PVC-type heme-binding CxxCH protein [Prosthecobacter sp.]|uniref:PVC-type heme-binding CxxCH protein n=1 Tax=Prosthecobacter sp. TaxID=1965333 RepID=UPI002AB99F89|nr:PVC-type heme-binding CxxCH protein [Prosthecobacter sp.]MDZ4405888.1 PVC-type heme-binding CxxCH protein [Prosthecobacter sp.]